MNSDDDDDDAEETEVLATTHTIAPPISDIPGKADIHILYERRAEQYLHLLDGRKALSNAVKAVKYRNDSYTAHWLVGKSYVSMAMYDPGIGALSTAIELCCLEDKRQEILIDLLVYYCSRKNELSVATEFFRRIGGHTWASVAYELTKSRRFSVAYIAYSQLQRLGQRPSGIHFDLQPLCDLDAVAADTWIIDLVTCFLRYGSDHNTMTSHEGDTYIHIVVRMSLAGGVLGLLEYVFGNVLRPGELAGLVDCLGNTALHMAAQYQNCSPLVRLDVMKLLIEAGIDRTAKNIEGKTAGAYLTRDEEDCLRSHQEYNSICSGMMANKIKEAVSKTYDNSDVAKGEEDIEELQLSTQAEHIKIQERQTKESTLDSTMSPQAYSTENDKPDTNMVNDTSDLFLQNQTEESQTGTVGQSCNTPFGIKDGLNNDDDDDSQKKVPAADIPERKDNLIEQISEETIEKDVPKIYEKNEENVQQGENGRGNSVQKAETKYEDLNEEEENGVAKKGREDLENVEGEERVLTTYTQEDTHHTETGIDVILVKPEDEENIDETDGNKVSVAEIPVRKDHVIKNGIMEKDVTQGNEGKEEKALQVESSRGNLLRKEKTKIEEVQKEEEKEMAKKVTEDMEKEEKEERVLTTFTQENTHNTEAGTDVILVKPEDEENNDETDGDKVSAAAIPVRKDCVFKNIGEGIMEKDVPQGNEGKEEKALKVESSRGNLLRKEETKIEEVQKGEEKEVTKKVTEDMEKEEEEEERELTTYTQENTHDTEAGILVKHDDEKTHVDTNDDTVSVADIPERKNNLIEYISEERIEKDVTKIYERKEENVRQGENRRGNLLQKEETKYEELNKEEENEVAEKEREDLENEEGEERVLTTYAQEHTQDTEAGTDVILVKHDDEESIDETDGEKISSLGHFSQGNEGKEEKALQVESSRGNLLRKEETKIEEVQKGEEKEVTKTVTEDMEKEEEEEERELSTYAQEHRQNTEVGTGFILVKPDDEENIGETDGDKVSVAEIPVRKDHVIKNGIMEKEEKEERVLTAYTQENTHDAEAGILVKHDDEETHVETNDNNTVCVATIPVRKDNLIGNIRKGILERGVPKGDKGKEENVLQEEKGKGNVLRNKKAKNRVVQNEVDEAEEEKDEEQVPTASPKGNVHDTECKAETRTDGIMVEQEDEKMFAEIKDELMRQERCSGQTTEKIDSAKSDLQSAGFAFVHKPKEPNIYHKKERKGQDGDDDAMDEVEDEDEDCNDDNDKMAICVKTKDGNEDDNIAIIQEEPANQTSNEFLDQISSELDDLPWEVECTKSFVKTMTSKVNSKIKSKIILTISQLAKGDWRTSIKKELQSPYKPKNVQLYEAKIGKGSRLIWQRAIAFSSKRSATTADRGRNSEKVIHAEVIRIWDFVRNHDDIYKHVVNICKALKNENQEDVKRIPKPPNTSQNAFPACFGSDSTEIDTLHPPVKVSDKEFQIVKFYTVSQDMLKHICSRSSLQVDFPFRVTDLEYSIINLENDAPILLIGRSGTGKTTCCLYRLWHQFIAHLSVASPDNGYDNCHEIHAQAADSNEEVTEPHKGVSAESKEDEQHTSDDSVLLHKQLHQIFVTRNKLLCSEAKRNFKELKHGSSIAQKFGLCEDNDSSLPWRFDDIRDSQYPLFLTLDQLLIMMDGSVGPDLFYARESNGSLKGIQRSLIEENPTIGGLTEHIRKGGIVFHEESSELKEACKQPTEVTYEVFCDTVWPKIGTGCKYKPSLVWRDFISIIKGSYESLLQPEGYLSREMYLDVGRKRAPNFDGNRDEIYTLFLKYQQFLIKKNFVDECDLVHSVESRLKRQHVNAWGIQQLFVDEIQDFTQAELYLLIRICQDPNQMFLTGDTAQTVMQGIEFRFSDLKSLFFNIREEMKTNDPPGKYLVNVPNEVHQLTHSYRSHDGILSLASSILEIMAYLFPASFDHLQADKSLIKGGPKPVLLESSNFSALVRHISDNTEGTDDTADIELGVHQAILVINETARQQLPRQLQQNITLTVYESKGLEFNNIFLFNFFKYSQASKEWQAVASLLTEIAKCDIDTPKSRTGMYKLDEEKMRGKGRPRARQFDPKRDKVLNSELKLLYTAVTRARVNVWIFDEDEENRRPMFEFFKARNLVEVKTEHFSKDELNKTTSEKEDWLARGKDFMRTKIYREAAKCFEKGGDKKSAAIASAYYSDGIARNARDQKSRKAKFLQAADLYCQCGDDFYVQAMKCYEEAGAFEASAEYCKSIGKVHYFSRPVIRL